MTPTDFTERAERCLQEVREDTAMHGSMSTSGFLAARSEFICGSEWLAENVTCVPGKLFSLVKTTL